MPRTEFRPEALDKENSITVAQIIVDGYSGGTLQEGQLVGIIVRNGDEGATTLVIGAQDGYVEQVGSGLVTFRGMTTIENDLDVDQNLRVNILGNGQDISMRSITSVESIGTSQQHSASLSIPAGAEVAGISVYVVSQPPGTSTMDIGVTGSAISLKRYGASVSTIVGSSNRGSETPGQFYLSSVPIILSFNSAPSAGSGSIRLTIHYRQITPPTS